MSELKPCPVPWCQGEATVDWYAVGRQSKPYWVRCTKCGCKTPTQYPTENEAITAWNTRAALQSEPEEPTEAMIHAGCCALYSLSDFEGSFDALSNMSKDLYREKVIAVLMAAMRSAAPKTP